jgi:hypothetical protein
MAGTGQIDHSLFLLVLYYVEEEVGERNRKKTWFQVRKCKRERKYWKG